MTCRICGEAVVSMILTFVLSFQKKRCWNRCVHSQLGAAYASATTGAVVTALGLKSVAKVFPVARVNLKKKKTGVCVTADILFFCRVSSTLVFLQHLPPIVSRFVPFAAVAAANCINIPFMRQRWGPRPPPFILNPSRSCPPSDFCHSSSPRELKYGIPVTDENGNRLGESPNAAKQAIAQVVVSRIGMAVPAMGKDCGCS